MANSAPAAPTRDVITGLVLAGGRGQRMGGVDKGLQPWRGVALVDHARIARLAPQVREAMVSANRHAAPYYDVARRARAARRGSDDFPGPLAGILAGLRAASTLMAGGRALRLARNCPLDLWSPGWRSVTAAIAQGAVVQRDHGFEGLRARTRLLPAVDDAGSPTIWTATSPTATARSRAGSRATRRRCGSNGPGDAAAFANVNTLEDLER